MAGAWIVMSLVRSAIAILLSLLSLAATGIADAQTAGAVVLPNQGAPRWVPIETELQPLDYKLYDAPQSATNGSTCAGARYNCEVLQTTADAEYTPQGVQRIRPPAFSYFVTTYPT